MIYILIILAGNGSYMNSSTTEFSSLESCNKAEIQIASTVAKGSVWVDSPPLTLCVPK